MHNRMKKGLAIACGIFLIIAAVLSCFTLLVEMINYVEYRNNYYDYEFYYDDYYEDDYYEDDYYEDDYYEDDHVEGEYEFEMYEGVEHIEGVVSSDVQFVEVEVSPTYTTTISIVSFLQPVALLLLAIAMFRRKKDIFAGISLSFFALTVLPSLFPWFGFSLSTVVTLLQVFFLIFLAVICFSAGKIQLKSASVILLVFGMLIGFSYIYWTFNILRFGPFGSYYNYGYIGFSYAASAVLILFYAMKNLLFVGIYCFLGGAFIEGKDQPVQAPVSPAMPEPPYTPRPLSYMPEPQPYMPAPPAAAPSQPTNYDQLRQLKVLLDEGVITEEEFEEKKRLLLNL